jgi:hypothetical protein
MADDIARRKDKKGVTDLSRLKIVGAWREHAQAA